MPPQSVCDPEQVVVQAPIMQAWPAPQAWPQLPQSLLSVVVLAQ
jgi:hypothetical protein